MKSHEEVKEMLDHIISIQQDAEHKLDEHFLMPYERVKYAQALEDAARDAQVLLWVLGEEEAVVA